MAQRGHGFGRWVLFGGMPQHRIVPAIFAEAGGGLVDIQDNHTLVACGGFPKCQVDGAQQAAAPSRQRRA